MLRETPAHKMKPSGGDATVSDGRDQGGDPPCWAHLFEDAAEADGSADQDPASKTKIS